MGTPTIEHLSRDQARTERDALLVNMGMTLDEVSERADAYLLTEDQVVQWWRIKGLTWLLDER